MKHEADEHSKRAVSSTDVYEEEQRMMGQRESSQDSSQAGLLQQEQPFRAGSLEGEVGAVGGYVS